MTESVTNNESEQCVPRTGVDFFLSETTPIVRLYVTTSRARILFDDSSRSAGSENEAAGKGCAVKSAKVEYCAKAEGAGYFQKGASIFFLA